MKTGISTASFFTKVPTESCFKELIGMGVDTTEVFLSTYSEYEKGFVDALAARLNGTLKVHSVHALSSQFEGELFSPSNRVRDDAERLFRKVCYAANALGAKYYTFHGPLDLKKSSAVTDVSAYAEKFAYLADIAKTYGVRIAVENVHYCKFASPELMRALMNACPALCATIDVKHSIFSGCDPLKYIDAVEDRLVTLHVTDVTREDTTALPGKGKYDFERLLKELDKRGLEPAVIIEAYARDFAYIEELKASYDYLCGIADKV